MWNLKTFQCLYGVHTHPHAHPLIHIPNYHKPFKNYLNETQILSIKGDGEKCELTFCDLGGGGAK